ncbi:hypothetical protein ACQPZF_17205 [Actinosynnema sp. CS-041913]|uniref:hypothetical protein n=1 Tax=Actinosynnema sp. CS-041913 TaxID=3239917 RepID=UPI003D9119D9
MLCGNVPTANATVFVIDKVLNQPSRPQNRRWSDATPPDHRRSRRTPCRRHHHPTAIRHHSGEPSNSADHNSPAGPTANWRGAADWSPGAPGGPLNAGSKNIDA